MPWSPGKGAPPLLVSAAETLFTQGLPDPRGCDYRQISVQVGSVWGGGGYVAPVHGWVLPSKPGDPVQFGIAWNGLVYPLAAVGAAADLDKDINTMVDDVRRIRTKAKEEDPGQTDLLYQYGVGNEGRSVTEISFDPLKACLLLRFGRTDLARKYWAECRPGQMHGDGSRSGPFDPYEALASDWKWNLYDRAICAHMRGDDPVALLSTRECARIQPLVDAELARRGFPKHEQEIPYKNPIPELLADQERRAKEPPHVAALTAGLEAFPDKAARIRALILDLDKVSACQHSQPGGVDLSGDPIVRALVAQGDDAVEPLLDTFVNDTRLTRSVSFGRDFHPGRTLHGVSSAAYSALAGILKATEFGLENEALQKLQPHEQKVEIARSIRAYWIRYGASTEAERWYQILADDHATKEQWILAAKHIATPDNIELVRASMNGTQWITHPLGPGQKPGLHGEPLRSKQNPSVSDLLASRASQIAQLDSKYGSLDRENLRYAAIMAVELADWDPARAAPALQAVSRDIYAFTEPSKYQDRPNMDEFVLGALGRLIVRRWKVGDTTALSEYAAWMKKRTMADFESRLQSIEEPMWRFPDNPDMIRTADRIFGDKAFGFRKYVDLQIMQYGELNGARALIVSPVLGLPACRRTILNLLTDKQVVGRIVRKNKKTYTRILTLTGNEANIQLDRNERELLTVGSSTYRVCDVVAEGVSEAAGAPAFKYYWPLNKRDAAVAKCAAFLARYGDRFRDAPEYHAALHNPLEEGFEDPDAMGYDPFHRAPDMTFPLADGPATAADVRDGRAIFALPPGARAVKGLPLPMKAVWLTYKDDPWIDDQTDPKTYKQIEVTRYHQDGIVWQAEEALVNGKWTRYYGFVGSHTLAKAPAPEIEFGAGPLEMWRSLDHGLDARLELPGPSQLEIMAQAQASEDPLSGLPSFGPGDSLPVIFRLRNRGGLPQTFPSNFVQTNPLALREGIAIELRHVSMAEKNAALSVENWSAWPKIAPKPAAAFAPDSAAITLAPTESAAVARFDLQDFFDITQPGLYIINLSLAPPSGLPAGMVMTWPFVIRDKAGKG